MSTQFSISNLKVGLDEDLQKRLKKELSWRFEDCQSLPSGLTQENFDYRIRRKAVDARSKRNPHFVVSVDLFEKGREPQHAIQLSRLKSSAEDPVIVVGAGPAGLFAALRLLERGIPVHLIEQGSVAEKRIFKINRFWRYGELDKRNNVGFGEGGAGLYSDGKLITRIKSPHIPYVLQRLVEFGAPEEILYLSNPHVGSDKIRRLIPKLRARLLELGGQLSFDQTVEGLHAPNGHLAGIKLSSGKVIASERVILACGHSSEELFENLHSQGVFMEGKSFAMGIRIEHPQQLINKIQYKKAWDHPSLGAANYRLAHTNKSTGVGVYSFCMCPGGYVLSSGTHDGQLVTNGMSNFKRGSKFANSAIVASIDHQASFGKNLFGGMKARTQLEKSAYNLVTSQGGSKQLPAQSVGDFLNRKLGEVQKGSSPSGTVASRVDQLFSEDVFEHLATALEKFEKTMPGFASGEAQVYAAESRTSCPLRITRDPTSLQSLSHPGLYPCGEGAGYAGGITSAACDGIRIADQIYAEVSSRASLQEALT